MSGLDIEFLPVVEASAYTRAVRLPPTPRAPRLDPATRIVSFYALVTAAAVLWGALRGHANILVAADALGLRGERVAQLLSSAAIGVATGLLLVLLTMSCRRAGPGCACCTTSSVTCSAR